MLATAYSGERVVVETCASQPFGGIAGLGRSWICLLTITFAAFFVFPALSAPNATNELTTQDEFAAYARKAFDTAELRFGQDPTNSQKVLEFVRAGFDRGEFATNDTERAELAERCIDVCRRWVAREPNSAAAHYYLGMNLGQLARTKLLGALRIVDEMEDEFKAAAKLDEHFDHAGPDRNLGLLYLEAPVFASIGSRSKARQHLNRAVELDPDYPENRLNLLEAHLKWHDRVGAIRQIRALETLWPKAKEKLTGPEWDSSWADWQKRLDDAHKKLGDIPRTPGKPHQKA